MPRQKQRGHGGVCQAHEAPRCAAAPRRGAGTGGLTGERHQAPAVRLFRRQALPVHLCRLALSALAPQSDRHTGEQCRPLKRNLEPLRQLSARTSQVGDRARRAELRADAQSLRAGVRPLRRDLALEPLQQLSTHTSRVKGCARRSEHLAARVAAAGEQVEVPLLRDVEANRGARQGVLEVATLRLLTLSPGSCRLMGAAGLFEHNCVNQVH
mmetsp:Transcript_37049/g.86939  ORF Transcript_37049/g.86939 Transcript_37049/m.86939 type:complete len:212 (-) Transcript_37049:15-650(-)